MEYRLAGRWNGGRFVYLAQAIFEDLQHPDAEQVRHKLRALA